MDAAYIEGVISQFINQMIEISIFDKNSHQLGYKISEFEDMLVDYIASEVLTRGYFVFNSDAIYEDSDVLEQEWAVALNQMTMDVFGTSIDGILRYGTRISLSANKKDAVIYVNDGTFPLAQYDKKFEFENKNKDLDLSL